MLDLWILDIRALAIHMLGNVRCVVLCAHDYSLQAVGYIHRPALNAERFVPDPVPLAMPPNGGWAGGARLYRTGDRAM